MQRRRWLMVRKWSNFVMMASTELFGRFQWLGLIVSANAFEHFCMLSACKSFCILSAHNFGKLVCETIQDTLKNIHMQAHMVAHFILNMLSCLIACACINGARCIHTHTLVACCNVYMTFSLHVAQTIEQHTMKACLDKYVMYVMYVCIKLCVVVCVCMCNVCM